MEAVYKRRALPPRPTLLVGKAGDVEACRSSWAQLKPVAEELLRRAAAGCASVEELDNAVRRFRSLRESLVAAYVHDALAIQVYECSADICLAARCWPEFLKSVAGLTADLYPHLEERQRQRRNDEADVIIASATSTASADAAGGRTVSTASGNHANIRNRRLGDVAKFHVSASAAADGLTSQCGGDKEEGCHGRGRDRASNHFTALDGAFQSNSREGCCGVGTRRRDEMLAAHVLFLACAPWGRMADAATLLRNPMTLSYMMSQPQTSSGVLRFIVQVLSALASGDWFSFLRLLERAPKPNLRVIMEIRAAQVRRAAVRSMAAAFRSVPLNVAVEMLRLQNRHDTSTVAICPSVTSHSQDRLGGISGSVAETAALQAVLEDAAAAGVRGAQVALRGLSTLAACCTGSHDGALPPAELSFRS